MTKRQKSTKHNSKGNVDTKNTVSGAFTQMHEPNPTSTGAEDDLGVSRDSGIWERRRNATFKNKRMVKLKDKDKLKVKPCKTYY